LVGVALVEDDHSVEVGAQPLNDLPNARKLFTALVGAKRSVGGEKDAFREPDRHALSEARQRRDQQPLHAERGPVALRILDQLVGFADPDRAPVALSQLSSRIPATCRPLPAPVPSPRNQPRRKRTAFSASSGAAATTSNVESTRPGTSEKCRMRFAGIDDALELGVRQNTVYYYIGWQMRSVGRLWRRDGGHGCRLHELGRMRLRTQNADRLQRVSFIKRIGDLAGTRGNPVDRLVGDFCRTGSTAGATAAGRRRLM